MLQFSYCHDLGYYFYNRTANWMFYSFQINKMRGSGDI